jgi:hypothetical protein
MERTFGIIPASFNPYMFIWILSVLIGLIAAGIIGLLISFGYQARHASFTVTDQGLRIGPGLYGRFIPKEDINAEGVRLINLNIETGYRLKRSTNGAGLPGFAAGWFKLENKEKALLFVTDRSNVVYIPTTANYSVMLSVQGAREFVDLLQRWR